MADAPLSAIITGAASGLGRALAVRLARDGWRLALADIDEPGAAETLKSVTSAGGEGRVEHLDVTQLDQWDALHERLRADWSGLDLLINNAGVGCSGEVGIFPIEEWRFVLNVNLYGGIFGCHTLVDWLKESPRGAHIINVASFAAIASSPAMGPYNVSKAGLVALSETLYGELKPHGVGVTVVCPMYFRTNIDGTTRYYDELRNQIIREGTDQSKLTADDVAYAAIRAMHRKELYAIPGFRARWYWWMRRLMPTGFLDGIARDLEHRQRAQPEGAASTNGT